MGSSLSGRGCHAALWASRRTPSVTRTASSRRTSSVAQTRPDYGDAIAEYRRFFTIGVDGYSLTPPTPPSPPERCGSSRAGHIWPSELVADDNVRYALPRSGGVSPYARAFAAWPSDH